MSTDAPAKTGPLAGLKVVAFETRMAKEMHALIRNQGGQPLVITALQEVPVTDQEAALEFGRALLAGECDVLILLTGVGTRALVEVLTTLAPREAVLDALRRTTLVARGPKPVHALGELGLKPAAVAPEPNTWRELLAALDAHAPVAGKRVAVQEYGEPADELLEGLAARRPASVTRVPVYRWALPDDLDPLKAAVREIAAGRTDVALFTSAISAAHLMRVAQAEGQGRALRAGLARGAVGAVGPTTSAELRELGLEADFEPEHPKMGHLVLAAAARARGIVDAKRAGVATTTAASPADPAATLRDSVFLRACRREPVPYTPVWLMRQAGRYMKEYRLLRQSVPFLELCRRPELAADVTVNAVERIGADAAIIFSDLLIVCEPMGFPVAYTKGEGPVFERPVRSPSDVDRVRELDPARHLPAALEAIRLTRGLLPAHIPLIGFAGAPFTLASYFIEGEGSRTFARTKAFMDAHQDAWHALCGKLAAAAARFLNAQVAAGAQAVQVFDSWVGCLTPDEYRRFVQPHTRALFAALPAGVPAIHFGTGTGPLLPLMKEAGGTVIGVDAKTDLGDAWDRLGPDVAVMGNLDPQLLLGSEDDVRAGVRRVLARAAGRPGHIFNLGHGILPPTPVANVRALIAEVHAASRRP